VFSQRLQRNVAAAQRFGHLQQILQATSEPIELPDHERVAAGKLVNRALQARSRSRCTRNPILVNDGTPGRTERIELQRRRLFVRGDARVAHQTRRTNFGY
jgi:hypothetical protein